MRINQALLTGTILIGAGAYKTINDYNEAPKEQKNRVLVRNTVALGTAALAVFSTDKFLARRFSSETLQDYSHKISSAILNNKFVKKTVGKLLPKKELHPVKFEALSDLIANCTKDVLLTASAGLAGIVAGVGIDQLLYRNKNEQASNQPTQVNNQELVGPRKSLLPKKVSNILENPYVAKVANEKTKDLFMNTTKVFEAAGFIQNPFEMPSVVLGSLDMAKEKNFQKIVEQSATGIVAEALIPTLCISVTNSLTKNKSWFVKLPAIAASFYAGNFVGEKVGDVMTHEIRDEFFEKDEDDELEEQETQKT